MSSPAIDAFVGLLRSHAATTRELSAQLQAEHGLTISDYEALLHLSHADGNRLKRVELAERLILTPSGVTRLLEGLERAGYVEKGSCSTDARVTYAVLTEAGRRKLEEAAPSHVASVRALFEDRLDENELATLAELLGRLPLAGSDAADCSP
ncbi:MAG TPA: MarR family winged helix-turn-helix transcriptional regulator [Gaiellaceae bacterium]|nr:MarR family winged helix-turn-helix transcriptional regulator [Gaiellaceae bacterium]